MRWCEGSAEGERRLTKHRHSGMREAQTSDAQLRIGDSRDSGFALTCALRRANWRVGGMTTKGQPGTFISSGTAASYLEFCSTSDVLTLRTCGAAVRCVTKS